MKMMKKIATLILAVCLAVPCFSFLSHAAGAIQFDDPSATVGEKLELMGVIKNTDGTNLGTLDVSITMSYDTDLLKFVEGDGVTETEEGTLVYTGTTSSSDRDRKEFTIEFEVLKEGTTVLQVEDSTIKNSSGTVQRFTEGKSTIKISAGEGNTTGDDETDAPAENDEEVTATVDGVEYTIADKIPDTVIPDGYEKTTLEYGLDTEINVLYNEDNEVYLAYLVDEEFNGALFRYVGEDATFAPYEEISISDSVSIILLTDVADVVLPKEYVETELVINVDGAAFPAWQKKGESEFCIVYAVNNSGEKNLYQLDTTEGTYQRFNAPEIEMEDSSLIGRLSNMLQKHMDYVILVTGLGFLLFVLIIIILSVKLFNRNAELDEIYEEYGIDAEEEVKEDVIISLGDDDEEDVVSIFDDDEDVEMIFEDEDEPYVQEEMREVFPEDDEIDAIVDEVTQDDVILEDYIQEENPDDEEEFQFVVEDVIREEQAEETLGAVLKKQVSDVETDDDVYFDDDEDDFDNFSLDFIDLDD